MLSFLWKKTPKAPDTASTADTFAPPAPLQTAVLFLVFNRPETTAQVFEAIRKAKPPRLYVAADGPRASRVGEAAIVARVREIATTVDWSCEVKIFFREENLGCKHAVSGAITWFFEHEEQGIILEDDCLPNQSFFWFCEELLERYASDERVSVVTGNNFQDGLHRGEPGASYYFSKYNHCWGWASWRRAWKDYQGELPFWPDWSESDEWRGKMPDAVEQRYWRRIFDKVYAAQIDSWAYPWTASLWYYGGLTATPKVNLVSNIGFGQDGTHTKLNSSHLSEMATKNIGKIIHPGVVVHDVEADCYVFDHCFGGKRLRFPNVLLYAPYRAAAIVFRLMKKVLI